MNQSVPSDVSPLLEEAERGGQWTVLMMCGLAGSGKTTVAKAIQAAFPNYHRLSGDEIIEQKHGIYGVDYPASSELYAQYQDEQDEIYLAQFQSLLAQRQNIILEKSFYARADRAAYRSMAEAAGAAVTVIFLQAKDKELLWQRICNRSLGPKTADSALDISRDVFEMYWDGFEDPADEGAVVVVPVVSQSIS